MKISRALVALAATAALVLGGAGPALAGGSPHFIKSGTSASLSGTSLVVQFKEAGLSSGSTETIQASAHLDATYQCVNGGGNVPSDPKKTTVSSEVSASGVFTAGQNGNLVGRHRSTGITKPQFTERARYFNEEANLVEALEKSNVEHQTLINN